MKFCLKTAVFEHKWTPKNIFDVKKFFLKNKNRGKRCLTWLRKEHREGNFDFRSLHVRKIIFKNLAPTKISPFLVVEILGFLEILKIS